MKYYLDAMDSKYCFKTNPDFFEMIQLCQQCNRVPLPFYRSNKDSEKVFCKTCYFSSNNSIDHLINTSNADLKLLSKLVFSCEYFENDCNEEFSLSTLDKLIIHLKECPKKKIIIPSQNHKKKE